MRSIVLEVRVELGAKQQRDEPNEWQRRQEERHCNTRHWSRVSLEQLRRPAVGIAPFCHLEENTSMLRHAREGPCYVQDAGSGVDLPLPASTAADLA
jgi:hypothetical protein